MGEGCAGLGHGAANDHGAADADGLEGAGEGFAEFGPGGADEHDGGVGGVEQRAEVVEERALAALGAKAAGGTDVLERGVKIGGEQEGEFLFLQ